MALHVALTHKTLYDYDRRIALGPQVIRLRPAPHARTPIVSYSLKASPDDKFTNWQQDPFGNWMARLVYTEKVDHFHVEVDLVAEMAAINPFDFFVDDEAKEVGFDYEPELKTDLAPYLQAGAPGERLAALFEATKPKGGETTLDWLVETNMRLSQEVRYTVRMEPGVQTPEETLSLGSGSCRDSAWLLALLLRRHGLATRFVSGYLIQLTADLKSVDGSPDGPPEDFTDLHAWTEVFLPGAGWIGLDPTSGLLAAEGHIPLAATPAPGSAAPISGGHEPCEVSFRHEMKVERILETPRVTAPYTVRQWTEINALAEAVDARIEAADMRLTMGGEPTFVAAGDRDADEWTIGAVGPTKREYADRLIRRFRDRFAPEGLIHHGQGKWYPGEQLPRWAFSLFWRADETPLWSSRDLIAEEGGDSGGPKAAEALCVGIAERLEVGAEHVRPAYEDPVAYIREEHRLPLNIEPEDNRLEEPEARARLARVFDQGLTTPRSFVLPIQPQQAGPAGSGRMLKWQSEIWKTRRRHLTLAPGDSPAGFRLPLGSLIYIDEDAYPYFAEADPFDPASHFQRRPLPGRAQVLPQRGAAAQAAAAAEVEAQIEELRRLWDEPPPAPAAGDAFVGALPGVRTALAVEPRDGALCVFLPPTRSAEEFVDLVAAIEEAATALDQPVRLEGYAPPRDARIRTIGVTPDPGVIEVNVQPARSWAELKAITEGVYDDARHVGLDGSTFQLDGRPTGTGGGAHVVVGGATPADSPFLRRPDLLGSIVRYWQRHPSLSYLFSGLFIGPTSQAPRIDEARDDQLIEMELALSQIPSPVQAAETPPWLVDRILRNLLVDATGNTHRAEICIDKLYSPDGPTGRLGLVEFRGFEMPPHPEMALSQSLLVRALLAMFWETPYAEPLKSHGHRLRDEYLLPYYIEQDFREVLADLARAGFAMDPAWFEAHLEFRFPLCGVFEQAGIEVEVRAAIEPWHVLGEEGIIGGTARYVDSSLERLQIRAKGDPGERYAVACNGWTLPFGAGDDDRDLVAGVRFRAWRPPECLHPTIGVHSPLTIEVFDLDAGRSIGGCVHHVMHPGGKAYETRPVNGLEAQGRRLSRFETMG
ncbi:MAG: transglutaminase family protein, partial [Pseudomonadota bacterium]